MKKLLLLVAIMVVSVLGNAQMLNHNLAEELDHSIFGHNSEATLFENESAKELLSEAEKGGPGGGGISPIEDGLFVLAGLAGIYLLIVRRKAV